MKRVLVTGATGFIGYNLVRRLIEQGHHVRTLVRNKTQCSYLEDLLVELFPGDITNPPSIKEAVRGCNIVYHLAGIPDMRNKYRERLFKVHVEGTRNLMKAALEEGVEKVVHTSTIGAIGASPHERPIDELWKYNLGNLNIAYFDTKHQAEREAISFSKLGLPVVIVNPSYVLGPYDFKPSSGIIIVRFAQSARARAYLPKGLNIIDVDDVVNGHIAASERGRIGERYILSGHNLTYKRFLTMLADATGLPRPMIKIPYWVAYLWALGSSIRSRKENRSHQIKALRYYWYYDNAKATRELGFRTTNIETTIQKTVAWFRKRGLLQKKAS